MMVTNEDEKLILLSFPHSLKTNVEVRGNRLLESDRVVSFDRIQFLFGEIAPEQLALSYLLFVPILNKLDILTTHSRLGEFRCLHPPQLACVHLRVFVMRLDRCSNALSNFAMSLTAYSTLEMFE